MKYKDLVKAAFGLWYTRKDKSVAKLIINSMTREELIQWKNLFWI